MHHKNYLKWIRGSLPNRIYQYSFKSQSYWNERNQTIGEMPIIQRIIPGFSMPLSLPRKIEIRPQIWRRRRRNQQNSSKSYFPKWLRWQSSKRNSRTRMIMLTRIKIKIWKRLKIHQMLKKKDQLFYFKIKTLKIIH